MAEKPQTRSSKQPPRTRRAGIKREPLISVADMAAAIRRPSTGYGLLIAVGFAILVGAILAWSRQQVFLEVGRVMDQTLTVRAEFTVVDQAEAEIRRREARSNTPRVYVADRAVFENIRSALLGLPAALADVESVDQIATEIRDEFLFDADTLAAVRSAAVGGEASDAWVRWTTELVSLLETQPVLDRDAFQLEQQERVNLVSLRRISEEPWRQVFRSSLMNIDGAQKESRIRSIVRDARFREPIATMVTLWLVRTLQPNYVLNTELTDEARQDAANRILPDERTYAPGTVLVTRGDTLKQDKLDLLKQENITYLSDANAWPLLLQRVGAFAMALMLTVAMVWYLMLFCPRVMRRPARMVAIAGLLLFSLVIGVLIVTRSPGLVTLSVVAPTIFVASVVLLAYDMRTSLALGSVTAALNTLALQQSLGLILVAVVGVGMAIWQLRELRQRNALFRAGITTGLAVAAMEIIRSLIERPLVENITDEILFDALLAGGLGAAISISLLAFILPTIERTFGIVTGMTLVELRDTKHPLLRELQQRAPGTYNHSLTVATIAEAAAESIHANGLEVYVGALYHDVGKMNKPDYFIENQVPGQNRHSRLTSAMSLLVIVGHVKDGIEYAREYNLPRPLHHYIESHHGTTLVEFFYRQAIEESSTDEHADSPADTEYRYPGPRPRTKEAGILMLCDAVESATRAMTDPTPSRIESLVRSIADKRLADGQLDNCHLTLREVRDVEDAIIRTVCSVYHGRIAYPEAPKTGKAASDARSGKSSGPETKPAIERARSAS
jgi:cyclic-di-AMP phosphodiesterase PgpH